MYLVEKVDHDGNFHGAGGVEGDVRVIEKFGFAIEGTKRDGNIGARSVNAELDLLPDGGGDGLRGTGVVWNVKNKTIAGNKISRQHRKRICHREEERTSTQNAEDEAQMTQENSRQIRKARGQCAV